MEEPPPSTGGREAVWGGTAATLESRAGVFLTDAHIQYGSHMQDERERPTVKKPQSEGRGSGVSW